MNWTRIVAMLGPVLSALLAAWTGKNALGINSGIYEADAANWGLTGLTGLGSLGTLLAGLWAQFSSTKSISARDAVVVAALATLFTRAAMTGDKRLAELVAAVSEHVKGSNTPSVRAALQAASDELDPPTVQELLAQLERRLRREAAVSIEGPRPA